MPNFPVDVNSWEKSACYPRSTFCPLSDGASTCHRQITRTRFRACSGCPPRSQASLCPCTRTPISVRREETFARLRCPLGGDRPSQTARLPLSASRYCGHALEALSVKAGISPTAPRGLTPPHPSLPAILHMADRTPATSCGEGSRGLSV